MSRLRAFSSPELLPSTSSKNVQRLEDYTLDGISTNVKLLLKIIHEHSTGCAKDNDDRRAQRVAGMISIVDDLKSRIQRIQSNTKRRAELRRCNTDLRPNLPKEKKTNEMPIDDKEKQRRELNASLVARKSLQAMCSSLGKEKEIMASELSKKAQQLKGMEELVEDLKAQNEMLLEKVQTCASEHKKCGGIDSEGNLALQERNKELSDQLLNSVDSYRSLKRKVRDLQEENLEIKRTMEKMAVEIQAGLDQISHFKQDMAAGKKQARDLKEEISALEHVFESLNMSASKNRKKSSVCGTPQKLYQFQ